MEWDPGKSGSPIAAFRLIITKVEKEEKGGGFKAARFLSTDRLLHLFLVANPFPTPLKTPSSTYVSNGIFQDQTVDSQKLYRILLLECVNAVCRVPLLLLHRVGSDELPATDSRRQKRPLLSNIRDLIKGC